MKWANFLHFYQPPSQTKDILRKVTEESYRKIALEIERSARAKLTLNISASLTELFLDNGYADVIAAYRALLEEGKIELVDSAAYHPFLPKLPKSEIVRQIKLNQQINRKALGPAYKPSGFFAPEMVYTSDIGKIVKNLGYRWMILDESSFPDDRSLANDRLYKIKGLGEFYCFFRERRSSFKILSAQVGTGKAFIDDFVESTSANSFLLTGMDGETFGHHRHGLEKLLGEVFESPQVEAVCIGDLFNLYKNKTEEIIPQNGTWALFSMDEVRTQPFSRWYDSNNTIHRYQWELTDLALQVASSPDSVKSRTLLDKAIHSDQYWWASAKPWWNIDMIGAGAQDLLDAIRETPHVPKTTIEKAERLFLLIMTTALTWRKTGIVDKLVKEHIDEEARYRVNENLRGMPKKELEDLIDHLRKQMEDLVRIGEYGRAEEFKKRVKELEEQQDFFLKDVLKESTNDHQEKDWTT